MTEFCVMICRNHINERWDPILVGPFLSREMAECWIAKNSESRICQNAIFKIKMMQDA